MFILEEYRNKNIGSKLVYSFIEWSKNNNVENITVTAFNQNTKAINFYKKQGFKPYEQTLEINL